MSKFLNRFERVAVNQRERFSRLLLLDEPYASHLKFESIEIMTRQMVGPALIVPESATGIAPSCRQYCPYR